MTSEPTAVYLFGEFRLDPANHRLERNGFPVTLPPKAFQLLVLLVEKSGELLTKEALLHALWPDVVVQESNLKQQVSILRKIIGNEDRIENVPHVGYRFAGPVSLESAVVTDTSAPGHQPRARWKVVAAASAALLAVVISLAMLRSNIVAATSPQIRSLAVLPLKPVGPAHETDYLGAGIADAVINQIAALQSIEVRPNSAVQKYAGEIDTASVARELAVDGVVEGTIQRVGDRIRVRVQLVDARRNTTIFSGKFDERASDLFAVEDVLAGSIARALALETMEGDKTQAKKRRSREPGAYEAYLKAKFHWSKRTPESLELSLAHYDEAISRDPGYAAAYAGLAESLNWLSMHRVALPAESFPRARQAAAQSLSIDESLADGHVALGTTSFYYDWDWKTAERHLRRAIALEPQQSSARHILANLMIATGRTDEAVATMAEARRRDRLSVALISISSYQLYFARRHEEGIRLALQAIDRDSGYATAHRVLGAHYLITGKYDEGIAAIDRCTNIVGEGSYRIAQTAVAYAEHPGRRHQARALEPKLLEMLKRNELSPFDLVRYYSMLGDRGRALVMLREAMRRRDSGMVWLAVDPELDPLRGEPKFREMVAGMKLDHVLPPRRLYNPVLIAAR